MPTSRWSTNLPDLCDQASRKRECRQSVEGALQGNGLSLAQVFREAGFLKAVEVGHHFVPRPAILLSPLGITIVCRERSELREDLKAEPAGVICSYHKTVEKTSQDDDCLSR